MPRSIVKRLARPFHGRGWRLRAEHAASYLFRRPALERSHEIYWLSTGRAGTHFVAALLAHAANVQVVHERGSVTASVHRFANLWCAWPDRYWATPADFWTRAKLAANAALPGAVYTELTHAIFPVAWQIYQHRVSQGRRVKLVHLVREPVTCCRSMLRVERYEGGQGFALRPAAFRGGTDADPRVPLRSARAAASVWNHTNRMSRKIVGRVSALDASAACTVRVEDLRDYEQAAELFDWLELEHDRKERERIAAFLARPPARARHSHLARDLATPEATVEELELIREKTASLAELLGYDAADSARR